MVSSTPHWASLYRRTLRPALAAGVLLVFSPGYAPATETLRTTIDLNYTYEQSHIGVSIEDGSTIGQKYQIEYETGLSSMYELLANVRLELENTSASDKAETSTISPSLELEVNAPRLVGRFAYDGTVNKTEEFEDTSSSETYTNSYTFELELLPYYWPETQITYEKKRDYEESKDDRTEDSFSLSLRKEHGGLNLEFDLDLSEEEELMPNRRTASDVQWSAKAAYTSVFWWDGNFEVTYEIQEAFSEEFDRGVFSSEEEEYVHKIQARLQKSFLLTPRLAVDFDYEYAFSQDLLMLDEDYTLNQNLALEADMEVFYWLAAGVEVSRETETTYYVPPEEKEQSVDDTISLFFDALPIRWLEVAGKAEWQFSRQIGAETGASLDKQDTATYEISARHTIGDWWDLKVTGASEYEYEEDWLVGKEGSLKAGLDLALIADLDLQLTYEITRTTEYELYEPLAFEQRREQELSLEFGYSKTFSRFLEAGFTEEISLRWAEELDEVLSLEEERELTEDTTIRIALVDVINNMALEGEIARQATDLENDEEPMLVNITYSLKWIWEVRDLTLESTFKYDDSGDSFDQSTFNSRVAWSRDNVNVSGEYQYDKTYSEEIDETRQFNVQVNLEF